ncbi:MAG TPA: ATP-binding protein [Longimicrobiaceae bacterium]|nr:ATP-binding protein [Longimicrobiaceae bacterium]
MTYSLLALALRGEHDVVLARQRARQVAELLGFDRLAATRIATAVSEIARNAFAYAGGGRVEFRVEGEDGAQQLAVLVADRGRGIPHLGEVLGGGYTSSTGMGMGMVGSRRLMDTFQVESVPGGGTEVRMGKRLPAGAPPAGPAAVSRMGEILARTRPASTGAEVQEQNQELLRTLGALEERQEELLRLNRELEDTNRGVVALYAELDERAVELRRANEVKAQFLSYMSHEFRTPLDSILAISGLLLDRLDGPLSEEQETQVRFVRTAARDLLDMVDDLLGAARVDAGQVRVRPDTFTVPELYSALRAMLRPLMEGTRVRLEFEEPSGIPPLHTDEAKVAQVLRNFISNALKFTENGEVRVSAELDAAGERITFRVRDTGIGIAPDDQERIFRDFAQVDSPLQRRARGTGLGLPLSRKLAELLGGSVGVESAPGQGSTFHVVLPLTYSPGAEG